MVCSTCARSLSGQFYVLREDGCGAYCEECARRAQPWYLDIRNKVGECYTEVIAVDHQARAALSAQVITFIGQYGPGRMTWNADGLYVHEWANGAYIQLTRKGA